jgi:hypothetical protein
MEFESTESSSRTAPLDSGTIAGGRSSPGHADNIMSSRERFGWYRILIRGASTAATSAPYRLRWFETAFDHCGRFLQKFLGLSIAMPLIAGGISSLAWSGHLFTLPLALLAPISLARARSRLHAYAILLAYYAGASWPLVPGVRIFFGTRGTPLAGLVLYLGAATVLAVPAALLFTRGRAKPFAITGMFVLAALPPFGIIGWASPFLSAGVLFPGTGWVGATAAVALLPLLVCFPVRAAILAFLFSVLANTLYVSSPLPEGWAAIDTHFGGAGQRDPDFLAEFNAHEEIQQVISQSRARVLLFPEHVVTEWNQATETFWHDSLAQLKGRGGTVLLGVGLPRPATTRRDSPRGYYNALLAIAPERELVYQQRIPVPISMWKPWNGDGVPLHLFGPGTIPVREERAAVLLCYEQLLVWPFVSSAIERPTVLVTAANDYWATGTRIPRIQKACATSWARLFGLPLLSAVND